MRKADLVNQISEKTGIPKVDVLVTLECMFKEIKESLSKGENIYIRGFGSFITKRRGAKIDRNINKNVGVHSISRGNVLQQKIEVYHQLAHFWADSAHRFEPYAWYTGEYARLENSEKSLTFAAHLFLNGLISEEKPEVKQWEALQAKDLFE